MKITVAFKWGHVSCIKVYINDTQENQKPQNHSPFFEMRGRLVVSIFVIFQGCCYKLRHTTLGKHVSSTSYMEKTNSQNFN